MKKHVKRYLSLALTFALVFAIPFAFTQEASAASKKSGKVTVYKVTSEATTTNYSDGTKATSSSKYTYNKKGFMTKNIYSSSDGYYFKDVYKYNGKGYMTSSKTYNKKGKLTNLTKVTMKKGKPSVRKYYTVKGKKKKLTYQEKLIYKGKKLVKIEWKDLIEKTKGSYSMTDNGSAPANTGNTKFDEHGNIVEEINTDTDTYDGVTYTYTYKTVNKYTYDSAGNILKKESTETTTTVASDGSKMDPSVTTSVSTYKYKKMKIAKKDLTLG